MGTKGMSGKFFTEVNESGRKRQPEKMKKCRRKSLSGRSRLGRRPYPWRKKYGIPQKKKGE